MMLKTLVNQSALRATDDKFQGLAIKRSTIVVFGIYKRNETGKWVLCDIIENETKAIRKLHEIKATGAIARKRVHKR